jgi:sulfoxide reductase catalytic subunit YedY
MFHHRRPSWFLPEHQATPESHYWNRRRFLAGAGAIAGGLWLPGCTKVDAQDGMQDGPVSRPAAAEENTAAKEVAGKKLEAPRNEKFHLDRPLTDEQVAARYNNFYEFTTAKERVWQLTNKFVTSPWSVEVAGLCKQKGQFELDDLLEHFPLEERLYRFRCVEAWAMAVPWIGFPMSAFVKWAEPTADAKFVRMVTFHRPDQAPGQRSRGYKWPYYEGLSLPEATNELTLLAVGLYGKHLPKQHGAPIRLVVPWKYGFKSIKSIVRFEFTATQPKTFWNDAVPGEYEFEANVEPNVPHPRWSQATERMIGTEEVRPTLPYNGYAEQVAKLYKG